MATRWTDAQRQAIEARNHTILVSAAAGSGKTAVLVERIVTLLREGARLNRMLIVTFTRAAAAEMRQRISDRLLMEAAQGSECMSQALDDLESAEISTIHSFCQKVLKNEFQAVGIDPLSRIAEEKQTEPLFEQAYRDAMNELLEEKQNGAFQAFAASFSQRDIRDMVGQLHGFLMSLPHPFDWLEQKVQAVQAESWSAHPWYQVLVQHAARQLPGIRVLLESQDQMFAEPDAVDALRVTWQQDCEACRKLMQLADEGGEKLIQGLCTFSLVKAVTCRGLTDEQKKWQKRYKDAREKIKAIVKELAAGLMLDEDKLNREFGVIRQHLEGLAALVRRVDELYGTYKQDSGYLDFSDLEQMTMAVLSIPENQEALQKDYDHIFVDECQDVSAVQDAILQSIHGERSCMFMVGDVKQSIYRFRKAEPRLFLGRMLTYSDEENARERRIILQKNFRSRTNVLEGTNEVFRCLMKKTITELDYTEAEELIPGRETTGDPKVEIHLCYNDDKPDEIAAEVQVIARRIRELLGREFSDKGVTRPYQYRDMVILLPKVAGVGSAMAQLLEEQGVPVFYDGAESYFNLAEITAMTALIKVIDNPCQDVPLMASLKQTPFLMTDQELADIRLCKTGRDVPFYQAYEACCEADTPLGEKCRVSRETLADWRFRAETMGLSDFMWYLVRETGFYAACGALPEGALRQANLRMLCQRAAEYEQSGGYTLSGFIQQMEQQKAGGDDRSAKMLGENENLVRIMTIHKSKGLEFPVVFCARLNNKLHLTRRTGLLTDSRLGVCLPYVNREMNIRRPTMADSAFDIQRLLDEKAERARLLYVAMTRAREVLILVGSAPEKGRACWFLPESDYRIWAADSMLDWVMQTLSTQGIYTLSTSCAQPSNLWKIRGWGYQEGEAVDESKVIHSLEGYLHSVVSAPENGGLSARWKDVYAPRQTMPLKTSVTSLTRKETLGDPLPLTDADEDAEAKRQPETIVMPLRLSEMPSRPAFMEERRQLTGAERGTLIHHVLSLLELDRIAGAPDLREAIQAEIGRMVQWGCFSQEEAALADVRGIEWYLQSHLGRRMLQSGNIRREWSFNYRLDDNGALLQGVIDCAFEEQEGWVLVDYKTDRIMDEEAFVRRYEQQLNWYARALEGITGKKVKEMWLYALGRGKAYPVARQ